VSGYRENDRTATELASYAVLWWSALGVCSYAGIGGGVSRRMVCSLYPQGAVRLCSVLCLQANLPYTAWVAAYNTSFLLGYLLLAPAPRARTVYSPHSKLKVHPPSQPQLGQQQQQGTMRDRSGDLSETATLLEAVNRNGLAVFLLVYLFKLVRLRHGLIIGLSCRHRQTWQQVSSTSPCARWTHPINTP